jgi:hypothetical protein
MFGAPLDSERVIEPVGNDPPRHHIDRTKGAQMAKTPLSLKSKEPAATPAEADAAEVVFEPQSQKRRPESGRYRLQVDRQTKSTYDTFEAAQAQGMMIKKKFSQVQVAIYDTQASANTILELPA